MSAASYVPEAPFVPARGLESAHAQTVFGSLFRPSRAPPLHRERWDTPDGDFLDVDVLSAGADAPHVVLWHGLEGSSRSGYMTAMLSLAAARGWGATAINFRSCSGEPNRLARSYHAGDTAEAHWVVQRLRARTRGVLFAAGFSLGGNVLARLLGEWGTASPIAAAGIVSAPFDLDACADRLDGPGFWPRIYRRWFLRTLLAKAREKARRHPDAFDARRLTGVRNLRDFDDAVTAPLHGFAGVGDYYARSSSGPVLSQVRTPTLLLNSQDDPLAPASLVPAPARANPALSLLMPERGGHVGFVAGAARRPRFWGEAQLVRYFEHHLQARET